MSAHAENTELTEKNNKSQGTVPLTRGPAPALSDIVISV
jgi:hypothetical protein